MSDPTNGDRRRFAGLSFDPTVNAGHVLTAVVLLLGLVGWGYRLEARVDFEAERRVDFRGQYRIDQDRDLQTTKEIKDALRRIEDKLDRKADRPGFVSPGQ